MKKKPTKFVKVMFACDECGVDHVIDSTTKSIILLENYKPKYEGVDYVQYEEDEIPKEVCEQFNNFKWVCLQCETEMKEEMYTTTHYHI